MGTVTRYSPEVRERAIRMVADHPSQWAAIESVASKLAHDPRDTSALGPQGLGSQSVEDNRTLCLPRQSTATQSSASPILKLRK